MKKPHEKIEFNNFCNIPGGRILLQHYFVKRGVPNFVEFFCKYQFGQVYFPDMHEFVEPCCRHLRFANTQDITLDADLTYQHYIDMLEANRDEMEAVAGPKVWRACRITYASAGAMLTTRDLLVYHTILVRKDDQSRVPLAQWGARLLFKYPVTPFAITVFKKNVLRLNL